MIPFHTPVMYKEVMEALCCSQGKTYLDCTFGDGGHSEMILKASAPDGRLIATDRDIECIERATERLKPFAGRFSIFNENFDSLAHVMELAGVAGFDGILMDFGISSYHLACVERGFSFTHDAPLDMRLNRDAPLTAYEIVNKYPEKKLADIFFKFGDEWQSRRIAREICAARKKKPIQTTTELGSLVHRCKSSQKKASVRSETKVFQALRIAVNDELQAITKGVEAAIDALLPGGRLCTIAFHSLEDRIVKLAFRERWKADKERFTLVTPKPLVPSKEEARSNPRSRSAKLRVIERLI